MANFKDWALQYVLADDEPLQFEIAKKAAKEIESSNASRATVGNWAASVQPWMSRAQAGDDDLMEDGDDGGSGDIIARAKALGFLAGTLEALDKTILRTDQIVFLVGFFGSMFSYDHKAGITASTKALRQLFVMKGFKPDMGVKMLEDVCKLKEDFRLQSVVTRLEIYELFRSLVKDPSVSSELQHKYGSSCGFVVDLLQLCQHERDPRNLMLWFDIIASLVADYSPSEEVTGEIFKAFSAYFPISLKSSSTRIGITADDLKVALRSCFAAHQRLAPLTFPFLIQKLDQGDAVTVAVKLDILRTIKACVESYEHPQASLVPYIGKIWGSLKYEVRNGEVKETIDATLDVLRAIADKLDGSKTQKLEASLLKGYIDTVFKDCKEDLANPTYTKQAGLLVMTVITANIRGYVLESAALLDSIRSNFRQPKSPSHTRDLLLILNSILKARLELVKNRGQGHPEDAEQLKTEPRASLDALFHDIYLSTWTAKSSEPSKENTEVLKQVVQGLALLVSQQTVQQDGQTSLLCSGETCSQICTLLIQTLIKGLTLSSNDKETNDSSLEEEAQLALRTVGLNYTQAYEEFARTAKAEIKKRDWANASAYSLEALRDLLFRLAFVGCSELPHNVAGGSAGSKPFSPLQHFITSTATLLELFPLSVAGLSAEAHKESPANSYVIAALHAGLLFFRDACVAKYGADALVAFSRDDKNWVEEFGGFSDDWIQQLKSGEASDPTLSSLGEEDPEVYRQFLRLSLFIVRYLYRSATAGVQTVWSGRILSQVSNIAAFVIRNLDEKLQISCNLANEAFTLFSGKDVAEGNASPFLELLTRGVLEGLWPGAMAELYNPGGIAENIMCNPPKLEDRHSHQREIRASVALILANKHKMGPSTSDPESQTMKKVLGTWGDQLKASAASDIDLGAFESLNTIAMHIFAGAVARQDRNVLDLVPVLKEAIASEHVGDIVSRSMGILVTESELLLTENHAVVRRFYKQWAYSQIAKQFYPLALPSENGPAAATRYRAAILSIVSNCAFSVYEADVEPLLRLLITTLGDRGNVSPQQLVAALEVLVEILANEPDSLKSHLKAVIGGAIGVSEESLSQSQASSKKDPNQTSARKLALQALAAIPKKFEERYLLPHALRLQRVLAMACGDPVREVRLVARLARGNWAKVK
ncbi:Dos2-interacting transcription regulator of RNA-Pol-II-domain-containing protein [Cercophora newfieldiana]|uniref:MMS19 nucleotide excision repair protein n=1 Tax=Cercophora newfieldiana TaxID=92897 RepID=A0AA39YN40_9PEZI|nr:Dos2-interacting transcription regulator of RNA-Pol-II-domain-containing protein [Cercophora newfieldiana]